MKLDLVMDLLQMITELDRTPFPEGAALSWQPILDGLDYEDCRRAIMEHYASATARDGAGRERRILPTDVRNRARQLAEDRLRAARRELPMGRVGSTGRPPHILAELTTARQRAAAAVAKHKAAAAA